MLKALSTDGVKYFEDAEMVILTREGFCEFVRGEVLGAVELLNSLGLHVFGGEAAGANGVTKRRWSLRFHVGF
jgi:hypothetical protein